MNLYAKTKGKDEVFLMDLGIAIQPLPSDLLELYTILHIASSDDLASAVRSGKVLINDKPFNVSSDEEKLLEDLFFILDTVKKYALNSTIKKLSRKVNYMNDKAEIIRKLYLYWYDDCPGGADGFEEFDTEEETLAFLNKHPSYKFRLINGHEVKIEPLEIIKTFKLKF